MSRSLDPTTLANINKNVVHPFNAIELNFDGDNVIRLWTGVGTLTLGDGTEWAGAGTLLSISDIEETAEMAVKGATISLSGIPSEVISLALSEPYQGRVCNIYFGTFTEEGALLKQSGDYILLQDGSQILVDLGDKGFNEIFSGYMDQMNIGESAETSTISVTVENRLVDLERARVARYTSGYQKSIYAGDLGLDFIEDLQDQQIAWGRKSGT